MMQPNSLKYILYFSWSKHIHIKFMCLHWHVFEQTSYSAYVKWRNDKCNILIIHSGACCQPHLTNGNGSSSDSELQSAQAGFLALTDGTFYESKLSQKQRRYQLFLLNVRRTQDSRHGWTERTILGSNALRSKHCSRQVYICTTQCGNILLYHQFFDFIHTSILSFKASLNKPFQSQMWWQIKVSLPVRFVYYFITINA